MRRFIIWGGSALVVLVTLALTFPIYSPFVLGLAIDVTCSDPPSPTCQTRMRALGHIWSRKGSLERAMEWYERAAKAGDAIAMFHLGWAYLESAKAKLPTPEELENAVTYKRGPVDVESDERKLNLEMHFTDPMARFNAAASPAEAWFRKSAELGFAPAMNNLGEMYQHGIGIPRNPAEGFRWHLRSAEAGNPCGASNVAVDYRAGTGTSVDIEAAKRWEDIDMRKANLADLAEPTFGRTLVLGFPIPEGKRDEMRISGKLGLPVHFLQRPMAPDPTMPAFKPVATPIRGPS